MRDFEQEKINSALITLPQLLVKMTVQPGDEVGMY
jgi:hypothetical protein